MNDEEEIVIDFLIKGHSYGLVKERNMFTYFPFIDK